MPREEQVTRIVALTRTLHAPSAIQWFTAGARQQAEALFSIERVVNGTAALLNTCCAPGAHD